MGAGSVLFPINIKWTGLKITLQYLNISVKVPKVRIPSVGKVLVEARSVLLPISLKWIELKITLQ